MAAQLLQAPGQRVTPGTSPGLPAEPGQLLPGSHPGLVCLGMALSNTVFMEFGKGEAPNVLFQLFSVEQSSGWISSGPQSKCVGDSCNQHRGAYTVDEQKQLLEKRENMLFCS